MTSSKRSVLITGCSDGGLGASLAEAFHEAGLEVYATARNPAKMAHIKSLGIKTLTLDVLSEKSIAECVAQLPSLDILINNAGAMYAMPVSDMSITEAKKLFDLNVWSYISVTQAFLPLLLKSKGIIANQTSILSVVSPPFGGAYGASKAAMAMLSNTMRLELEPFGIKVIDLKTGAVTSQLFQNAGEQSSPRLPKDSIYAPFADIVEKAMRGEEIEKSGMLADKWAKLVVGEVLAGTPKAQIWKGASASVVRIAAHLPFRMSDGTMRKMGGTDEIIRKMRAGL